MLAFHLAPPRTDSATLDAEAQATVSGRVCRSDPISSATHALRSAEACLAPTSVPVPEQHSPGPCRISCAGFRCCINSCDVLQVGGHSFEEGSTAGDLAPADERFGVGFATTTAADNICSCCAALTPTRRRRIQQSSPPDIAEAASPTRTRPLSGCSIGADEATLSPDCSTYLDHELNCCSGRTAAHPSRTARGQQQQAAPLANNHAASHMVVAARECIRCRWPLPKKLDNEASPLA